MGQSQLKITRKTVKHLSLDSKGKLVVNKKAQMSAQMLTFIQNFISNECALKVVTSGENFIWESKMV